MYFVQKGKLTSLYIMICWEIVFRRSKRLSCFTVWFDGGIRKLYNHSNHYDVIFVSKVKGIWEILEIMMINLMEHTTSVSVNLHSQISLSHVKVTHMQIIFILFVYSYFQSLIFLKVRVWHCIIGIFIKSYVMTDHHCA